MQNNYQTTSKEETWEKARELAHDMRPKMLVCLSGDLGAGKTTFSQGVLAYFGAEEPYTSPTFVIMKEYTLSKEKNGIKRIYHVDAYRVEAKDIEHLGFEEWCSDPAGLVMLEWPERIEDVLPVKRMEITLTQQSETVRNIQVTGI
jgi:tRNA threonylcarbamoyladenosine biosynthesis protein TsaE